MEAGDALPSLKRPITQELINKYAEASGDFNPIHVDHEFAASSQFGRTIAHGMLVTASISEMMTLAFGSLRIGLVALVPNLFPIVMVIGTMGWMGLPVNIATAMRYCWPRVTDGSFKVQGCRATSTLWQNRGDGADLVTISFLKANGIIIAFGGLEKNP